MRRRLPLVILLLALSVPSAGASAAPVTGVSIASTSFGLAAVTADFDQAVAVGAPTVRLDMSWAALEPQAAGQRDPEALGQLDAMVAAARARRLRLVLLLQRTPCWASSAPAELRAGCQAGVESYPPRDPAPYGRLAAFLAARYHGALAALEVWNEPDQANERYWAGPDKVRRYVALARATYRPVKAADPSLPVLAGAFVGTDGRWLQALYDAGIKGLYDGLSVHFYDLPLLGLRQTRAVQRRNGDRKPLWLLETGFNSCAPAKRGTEGQPCFTRAGQARALTDLLAQTRRTSYLAALVIYKLRDDGADSFGLLDVTGRAKPAFGAVRSALRHPVTRARAPKLAFVRRGSGLQLRGSGPDGDVYDVEVRAGGVLRYRATLRLDSRGRFTLRMPSALGRSGLRATLRSRWSARTAVAGR